MMKKEKISISDLVSEFNRSELRHSMVPMELASGWPSIHRMGKTLCITIPYFSRGVVEGGKIALKPISCSVTLPVRNPKVLMDFTIYTYRRDWDDIDFEKPAGFFPHEALAGVKRSEYNAMCDQLFGYYDEMVDAVLNNRPFDRQDEMSQLFKKLMEPCHYPQYLRINKKFYSNICGL